MPPLEHSAILLICIKRQSVLETMFGLLRVAVCMFYCILKNKPNYPSLKPPISKWRSSHDLIPLYMLKIIWKHFSLIFLLIILYFIVHCIYVLCIFYCITCLRLSPTPPVSGLRCIVFNKVWSVSVSVSVSKYFNQGLIAQEWFYFGVVYLNDHRS